MQLQAQNEQMQQQMQKMQQMLQQVLHAGVANGAGPLGAQQRSVLYRNRSLQRHLVECTHQTPEHGNG